MSLVELLLSVAILSIIGYAIISLFPTTLLYLRRSHDSVAACQLGQQVMEQLRQSQFSSTASSPTTRAVMAGTLFNVASTVRYDFPDVKHIVVTVSWADGVGLSSQTRSLTLETSVFRVSNP